jgi:hypothetical protein
VAESCTGSSGACPADGFQSSTTSCVGTSNGGACDGTDSCDGAGHCVDGYLAATSICRTSAGQCDVAESCTGTSGACPANGFQASTTSCVGTSTGGVCDGTDSCDGAGACVDGFVSATTTCRPSAGQCDVAESCTGTSGACPADGFQASTTTCVGTSNGGACDGTDSCDGAGVCVDGYLTATTTCRAATGTCDVAESCTGSSGACPADGFQSNGTVCTDNNACTQTDTCQSGACVGTNPVICNDNNTCTDDSCNTSNGDCVFTANNANSCTDGNVCTTDTCSSGTCVHAASGACGVSGTVLYYRDVAGAGSEPSSKPVPNVGIDTTQDALADGTTGSSGTYAVGSLAGNVTLTTVAKFGSPRASDHNSAITGTDAAQIARATVGLVTFSNNQRLAGDVTGNGTISSLDAAAVARFAALLVDHFDVATATGSDWKFLRCDAYAFPGDPGCGTPAYNFTPISQSETGKNFYAILYGDVTGNWAPAALFTSVKAGGRETPADDPAAFATVPAAAEQSLRAFDGEAVQGPSTLPAVISIDGLTVPLRVGERRELTIGISNADGILGLDLGLKVDATRVAIIGVQSAGIASGWGVAHSDLHGTHRISAYGVSPLAGTGAVLTVTVEGVAATGRAVQLDLSAVANEGAIPLRVKQQSRIPRAIGPSEVYGRKRPAMGDRP